MRSVAEYLLEADDHLIAAMSANAMASAAAMDTSEEYDTNEALIQTAKVRNMTASLLRKLGYADKH